MDQPEQLPYTGDRDADALLAASPVALIIGMVLYQQVPVEKAFAGPLVLQERLGHELDARDIADYDPAALVEVFRDRPAIHRFPANMAKRVQAVCAYLADEYDGDPAGLWREANTAEDVVGRMVAIPGFGDYKSRVYFGVLAARFGVRPQGWEDQVPDWPSIADVERWEDVAEMKTRKKAWKESATD
jgi:uncharacterized HhH-GPD family protein